MSKLIVSLDFEMRWGVQDRLQDDPNKYKDNLLSVRKNVPWILDIFKERNIKATWASVGALACKDWDEFYQHKPDLLPNYKDQQKHYVNNYNKSIDPQGSMHFADDLIHKPGKTLSDAADPWGKAFRWEQPWEKDVGGFFGDLVHGDQAWEKALKKEVKKDALATWVAGAKAGLAVASLPKNIATLGNQRGWQWAGDETNWSGGWGLTDDTNFLVPDSPDQEERAREGGWF